MSEKTLESIGSLTEAIALAVGGSGVALKVMADKLGIEYAHFSRMLNVNDSRHFPPDKLPLLMTETKSVLPLEWLAMQMGYALHESSLRVILESIRDAMLAEGKVVKFHIHESGRIEDTREVL